MLSVAEYPALQTCVRYSKWPLMAFVLCVLGVQDPPEKIAMIIIGNWKAIIYRPMTWLICSCKLALERDILLVLRFLGPYQFTNPRFVARNIFR